VNRPQKAWPSAQSRIRIFRQCITNARHPFCEMLWFFASTMNRVYPFRIAYLVKQSGQAHSFVCSRNSLTPSCTKTMLRHQQSGLPIPHTKLDPQISQRRSTGKLLTIHDGRKHPYFLSVRLSRREPMIAGHLVPTHLKRWFELRCPHH
jgi:hypothetical protein